jgi:hypothetical protein
MIGNEQSDVQNIVYPDLCVNKYDLMKIDCLLEKLIKDSDFYDHCVRVAKDNLSRIAVEECGRSLRENILKAYKERK